MESFVPIILLAIVLGSIAVYFGIQAAIKAQPGLPVDRVTALRSIADVATQAASQVVESNPERLDYALEMFSKLAEEQGILVDPIAARGYIESAVRIMKAEDRWTGAS